MNTRTVKLKAQWETHDRLWCVIDLNTRKIQCTEKGRPDIFTTRAQAVDYNVDPRRTAVVRLHDVSGTVL